MTIEALQSTKCIGSLPSCLKLYLYGVVSSALIYYMLRAKNQLRVNGVSFGLYFSTVFTVELLIMVAQLGFLVGIIYTFALKSLALAPAITVLVTLFLLWFPGFLLFNSVLSYSAEKVL